MFKSSKRRREAEEIEAEGAVDGSVDAAVEAPEPADEAEPAPEPPADRSAGPWDSTEDAPELQRLDVGSLRVPGQPGMELRLEADPSGQVVSVTCVHRGGSVQLQPFAAPKSGGTWAEVRAELVAGIAEGGGSADEQTGAWGVEVVAELDVETAPGQRSRQPVRFAGIDGPRWFLRAVFTGAAATDDQVRAELDEVLRGVVVVRGSEPRSPRELLPLRLPEQAAPAPDAGAATPERPPLSPFARGPEITEIR